MEQSIPDLIYVQNSEGQPLMPARRHNKVWYWLRTRRAHLVRRQPGTIQLRLATTNYTQPATVGVDTVSQREGIAAITKAEVICHAEVHRRTHSKQKLGRR